MKQTLLTADDDAELCDLYRRIFAEGGYEVATSSDGVDCLAKLRQVTPVALVLDLELHWGGGDGVLAWLREECPTHRVPVILTATAGYSPDSAEFIAPPVMAYHPKPVALTALLESVRSAIANNGRLEKSHLKAV